MKNINDWLNDLCNKQSANINDWIIDKYNTLNTEKQLPIIYSSVDLRHSGYKIAPVDTNLFPAGFNNLTHDGMNRAKQALQQYLLTRKLECKKILIISENHTRNQPYLYNLLHLKQIIESLEIEVVIGRFDLDADAVIALPEEKPILQAEGLSLANNKIQTANGFIADIVLLNNDLSAGMDDILQNTSQLVLPNPYHGWFKRRKSNHFEAYNQLASDFAHQFGFDPWLISTQIARCGQVDFKERVGLECVALNADKIIHTLQTKHQEYSIKRSPYVFVKADNGTYGMGIMTVRSGDELLELNKKERNKMNIIKEGVKNQEVIIQEGVPTIDLFNHNPAEPMVYLIGGVVVDIFWRSNANRDFEINLNAAGMAFNAFNDHDFITNSSLHLIARLATLACNTEYS